MEKIKFIHLTFWLLPLTIMKTLEEQAFVGDGITAHLMLQITVYSL